MIKVKGSLQKNEFFSPENPSVINCDFDLLSVHCPHNGRLAEFCMLLFSFHARAVICQLPMCKHISTISDSTIDYN